jgi:tape measure domain-containing protein
MANVVDTLVTRFTADTKQYETATAGMASATSGLTGVVGRLSASMTGAGVAVAGVAIGIGALVAVWAKLNIEVVKFGYAAFKESAQYDALAKSLEAVEGSATRATEAMKVLRDIAKLPGIGMQEATQAFTTLRQNGMSGAEAERVIRAAGNANALAGGGMDEFGRIMKAIREIYMRPNLSGEELNQLAEAGIPGHRIVRDAFGTVDGAELKRMGVDSGMVLAALIEGLEKMPKAANSAKNSLENLQSAISLSMAAIGAGAGPSFTKIIDKLTDALEDLEPGFKVLGRLIGDVLTTLDPFNDSMRGLRNVMFEAGIGVAGLLGGLAELNKMLKTWVTGDLKNAKLPMEALDDIIMSAARASGQFAGAVLGTRILRTYDDPKLGGAKDEADKNNKKAANHLAAIESNTRAMVDLQRHILGGGNIGAMGVTPIELSDIRRGGTGEEMVMSGIRMMVLELGVSSFGRRGMAR